MLRITNINSFKYMYDKCFNSKELEISFTSFEFYSLQVGAFKAKIWPRRIVLPHLSCYHIDDGSKHTDLANCQ